MSSQQTAQVLRDKIDNQEAVIGVIGLGYVGLPLLKAFNACGFRTIGYDVDQSKVDSLNGGKSYISHVPSEWISEWLESEMFTATADMNRLAEADALLICVPTPLNESRDPDLTFVSSTAREISTRLREGQLVVLESTTYPGTTRDVVTPILAESGLTPGEDFFVAYSPEREDPGNPNFTASQIPKVVGAADEDSRDLANRLYGQAVVNTVPVSSCEVAEASKIIENVYRCVNIAMVNELKMLFDRLDIDVWEVIDAAKTKPFGFQAFYPGPGLGGHCIPIDPFYLSWVARRNDMSTRFIELAGEINTCMPEYVVSRIVDALNEKGKAVRGSKICMLGLAYKKDVDDPRESPSFRLMELLIERGAEMSYNDPHIPVVPPMRHHDLTNYKSEELTPEHLASQDLVLVATDHSAYDWEFINEHSQLIVDSRNACKDLKDRSKIRKA